MIDLDVKEKEVLAKFEQEKQEMASHERASRACAEEMARLQGEYRLIQELKKKQAETGQPG